MNRAFIILVLLGTLFLAGCTEESRNKMFRNVDNILGKDFKVSYIDSGKVVKTWIVRDGKITSGKDEQGKVLGYYYFFAEKVGYVQIPIERTIIEELQETAAKDNN